MCMHAFISSFFIPASDRKGKQASRWKRSVLLAFFIFSEQVRFVYLTATEHG